MVPSYEEARQEGADCNVRSKVPSLHLHSYIYDTPHLYLDKDMVPSDEEDKRDGHDFKVRRKVRGEETP